VGSDGSFRRCEARLINLSVAASLTSAAASFERPA
jgi:hypothetical protein